MSTLIITTIGCLLCLVPGLILVLIMTKLLGHYTGYSLLWGKLQKHYSKEQVELWFVALESTASAFSWVSMAIWLIQFALFGMAMGHIFNGSLFACTGALMLGAFGADHVIEKVKEKAFPDADKKKSEQTSATLAGSTTP